MVQIIQPVISEKTARQQAMQSGFDQAAQGLINYMGAIENQRKTKRQEALDLMKTTAALRESGYDVSPEQVKAAYFQDQPRTFKSLFTSEQEKAPDTSDLFAKRTPEYIQRQQDVERRRQLEQAQLDELSKPFSQTREGQKFFTQEEIRNKYDMLKRDKEAELALIQKKIDAELRTKEKDKDLEARRLEKLSELEARKLEKQLELDTMSREKQLDREARIKEIQLKGSQTRGGRSGGSGIQKSSSPLSKLTAEERNKVGSIATGIQALDQMESAVRQGFKPEFIDVDTPILGRFKSDNPFTKAKRMISEVIGRLQSGGAIGVEEEKRFNDMGPRPGDTPEIAAAKIQDQKRFLENKLTAFGLNRQSLQQAGFDVQARQQEQNTAQQKLQRLQELRAKKAGM